jgi:hypothetical protein
MTERGRRDLGERGTQAARGLDRIARRCRELDAMRSRQMAELMYDGTQLPRNEQQYQAACLEQVKEAGRRPRRGHSIKANRMAGSFH